MGKLLYFKHLLINCCKIILSLLAFKSPLKDQTAVLEVEGLYTIQQTGQEAS